MDYDKLLEKMALITNVEELNLDDVRSCMTCEDFLIRCDTIELLAKFINNKEIEQYIKKALNDKNYLVRCEAYEAMEESNNEQVILMIYKRLKHDKSSTARMYAISSLLALRKRFINFDNIIDKLKDSFKKEKSKRVIIAYLALFYYIERDLDYISKALKYLNDANYQIRCNVINILDIILDNENENMIKNAYQERYIIETTRAVQSLLVNYI